MDALIDFKAEEKILREKIQKKQYKPTKSTKYSRKKMGLSLGMNPEIKEVESSENSDNESYAEQNENPDEIKMTPQKQSVRISAEKSDKRLARNKRKQELKLVWRAGHIMANILFLLLKDLDYDRLQQYTSLVNMLYITLSTDISQRFRYKERSKVISTIWLL